MTDEPLKRYRLRAELLEVTPPIWRTLEVPGDLPLAELHDVLQILFSWEDKHLYEFNVAGKIYGTFDDEGVGQPDEAAMDFSLEELVHEGDGLTYRYDFGDEWHVRLTVESAKEAKEDFIPIRCLAGARAGPLEDSHGTHGYMELLKARDDKKHPMHEEAQHWLPENYDPEAFERAIVNEALDALYPEPLKPQEPGTAFVTRLGPFDDEKGEGYFYLGHADDQAETTEEDDEAKALAELRTKFKGKRLYCEPELSESGAKLGYESAKIPLEVAMLKATVAWQMSLGKHAPQVMPSDFIPFLGASSLFMFEEPWQHYANADAMVVTLEREGKTRTAELTVMGAGGGEFGIALYEKAGANQRIERAMKAHRPDEAAMEDCIAVTLNEAAEWLVEAFSAVAPSYVQPEPVKLRSGQQQPITGAELHELATVMLALSKGDVGAEEGTELTNADGVICRVKIEKPTPKPKKRKKWALKR